MRGQVAVSPDGQHFVFERAAEMDAKTSAIVDPDLWLVNRDGSGLQLFVENAYAQLGAGRNSQLLM